MDHSRAIYETKVKKNLKNNLSLQKCLQSWDKTFARKLVNIWLTELIFVNSIKMSKFFLKIFV